MTSSSLTKKTAVILGGGFAGLAAGVFLDQLGYQIKLFEKKPLLGGRTYAFLDKKTNTWVDNGQHLLMGAYHETIKLIENIGATRYLNYQKPTKVWMMDGNNQAHLFQLSQALPASLSLLKALTTTGLLSFTDKLNLAKLAWNLKKDLSDAGFDQSVASWLTQMGQSQVAYQNFWEVLTLATLNDSPQKACARMLASVLQKGFMGSRLDSSLIIPASHLSDLLAKPAQQYLEMRGHEIVVKKGAKRLHILNNQVQAIELDDGKKVKADVIVSALPFKALASLIPSSYLESLDYFSSLHNLKSAPIVSINLWFDQNIMEYDFIGLAHKKVHWYFNKNQIHHQTNGPYHYMGVVSGAYDFLDLSKQEILDITLTEMKQAFPKMAEAQLVHSLVNKEREATLSIDAATDKIRPSQKSPFANFYVIGDWTQTGLPATIESAVKSARLASDMILAQPPA